MPHKNKKKTSMNDLPKLSDLGDEENAKLKRDLEDDDEELM